MSPNERSALRGFADRWPFRRKLNVLLGVPLAVIALLLTYLVTDLLQESQRARAAARLVRDSTQVARLVDQLEAEHQQAVLLSVRHEAAEGDARPSPAAYREAQAVVDRQLRQVRRTFGGRLPGTEAQALREVEALGGLRTTIEQGYLPAENIDLAYAGAGRGLIDGLGLSRDSVLAATFTGGLLDSLLRAGAAHGAFETGVFAAGTRDSNALIQLLGAVRSYEQYTYQADRFTLLATEEHAERLRTVEHNTAQAAIAQQYAELQIDPSGLQAGSLSEVRAAFRQALAAYPDYRAQAGIRLAVTTSLIGELADRTDGASADAQLRAGLLLGLALFGCAAWLALSVVVRRSVVRPVQALTGAAREVAEVAGRELARVADDDAEDDGPPRLRAMPVTARDEIGDLAEAFNRVQTTAAALLERQVLSRRNIAEMFGHVGRRVSNLTTRQLTLIDAVERGETDPALLERLYRIDHIAVRLRRNADSLILLAGLRETLLNTGPTELTTVVRAALGQIEGYQRVELHAGTEARLNPDVTTDLTLMIAELLDNAVRFSPADTPVEVTVAAGAEGATISVADHGLGLSRDRLAEENARLVRRERVDLVPTRVLGLFVVGTLARRWGIGVRLSRTLGGGVTAEVTVPASLTATGPAEAPVPVVPAGAAPADRAPGPRPAEVADGEGPHDGPDAPDGRPRKTAPGTGRDEPDARTDASAQPALPRRVPRRAAPAETPLVPGARTEPHPGPAPAEDTPDGHDSGRPLRQRVRGATLGTTAPDADRSTTSGATPRADADAVRSELEEFEAAVARAHRDSARDPGARDTRTRDPGTRDGIARGDTPHHDGTPAHGGNRHGTKQATQHRTDQQDPDRQGKSEHSTHRDSAHPGDTPAKGAEQ
ncbi:ATP-binding protein [Streptomyces sp. NPDC006458]|uniref:ATP-binding protein n=1 Tax=Streptomyces sp. NPDC006458 TaxID=3154302 RepID=UPI0033A56548